MVSPPERKAWQPRMVGGTEQSGARSRPAFAILLSLYNGEAFLNAQLDSILRQTDADWCVYWRDDGSSDSSRAIMLSFQEYRGHGRCVEVGDIERNVGIVESYRLLLDAAPASCWVAFADQDDVWIPQKLAWARQMLAASGDRPTLYCARQFLTDEALHPLGETAHLHRRPVFASALTQNIATGHTVVLNDAAAALLRVHHAPGGVLHDWWSYLLVTATGGNVLHDDRCVSHYRQHRRNSVGAPSSMLVRGWRALRRGPQAFMQRFALNVAYLEEIPAPLTPEARALLKRVTEVLAKGSTARIRFLRRERDMVRQGRAETWVFRVWFLLYRERP